MRKILMLIVSVRVKIQLNLYEHCFTVFVNIVVSFLVRLLVLLKINDNDMLTSFKYLNAIQTEINDAGLLSDWLKHCHMNTSF